MFLFADNFFAMLSIYRLLWIRGRLGGGKTLLAIALAEELCNRGITDGVVANIPHLLKLPNWEQNLLNGSCIVFDEAWTILDNRRAMGNSRAYGAFARKLQTYWLFPSVIPIDKRASFFYCERITRLRIPILSDILAYFGKYFKILKIFGDDIWIYRFGVNLGYTTDGGYFALAYPSSYFGKYDTEYIPLDDGDISQLWERTIYELTKDEPEQEQWWKEVPDPSGTETDSGNSSKVRNTAKQLSFVSGDGTQENDTFY